MTREYYAFVDSSLAAERVGDAETALEYYRGIPMFTRSPHVANLAQLAGLAGEMTPWLWARWAAYQCTRAEEDGTRSRVALRTALEYTVTMFHADQLHDAYVEGDDPVRVTSVVMGEDWAFHQVCTQELDGLETFLDELADGRLAEHSGLARSWVGARMGGYRVEPGPGLWVWDPERKDRLELLDLGARLHASEGSWVIGRVVPSGTTPELMFDTRPLRVDERTAREVAAGSGRGEWVGPLEKAIGDGRVGRGVLRSKDRALITDVPSRSLVEAGTPRADLDRTMRQLREGRDEVGRAAFRILRSVAEGSFGADERAPYVAAAVLNAHAHPEAQRQLVAPGQREHWLRWAELVPEPARGRLTEFADRSSADAA
jgi:hypothetical protein